MGVVRMLGDRVWVSMVSMVLERALLALGVWKGSDRGMRSRGGDGERAHIERKVSSGGARLVGIRAGCCCRRPTLLVGEIVRAGRCGGGKRRLICGS